MAATLPRERLFRCNKSNNYNTMLIRLQGVNTLFDMQTGDTFPIANFPTHHVIEEPIHIEEIELMDWFYALNEQDTAILMAYYFMKYETRNA